MKAESIYIHHEAYIPPRPICQDYDPEKWFPRREGRAGWASPEAKEAIAICNTCPLLDICLETALGDPDTVGVWGGTTKGQRAILRRKLPKGLI